MNHMHICMSVGGGKFVTTSLFLSKDSHLFLFLDFMTSMSWSEFKSNTCYNYHDYTFLQTTELSLLIVRSYPPLCHQNKRHDRLQTWIGEWM